MVDVRYRQSSVAAPLSLSYTHLSRALRGAGLTADSEEAVLSACHSLDSLLLQCNESAPFRSLPAVVAILL
jgi:hypothetical protein